MKKVFRYLLVTGLLLIGPSIVQGQTAQEINSETRNTSVSSVSKTSDPIGSSPISTSNQEQTVPSVKQQTSTAVTTAAPIKTQAIYRLYNRNSGEHFYTASAYEAQKVIMADWDYEGIGWYAPAEVGLPVYRLYNPNAGDHHYTVDGNEKNFLISRGWHYEGTGWNSESKSNQAILLYRAYNPNAKSGSHNYTVNGNEQNQLVKAGWSNEGIAWYGSGVKPEKTEDAALQALYQQVLSSRPKFPKPEYYSQLDGRWSGVRFNSSTVGPSGCVPTSLAMILKGSFKLNVTPADVAIRMDGYSQWTIGASGRDIIATANSYGRQVEVVTTQARAADLLKQGYPLIWLENVGIGHAVVSYGNSNGKTEVLDPYNRSFFNGWYGIDYLWSRPSADPMDWDAGRPVFAIK
jgi:hypothetical protein